MRLTTLLFALTFLMPLSTHAQVTGSPTGIVNLPSLRDTNRPLLIFAPSPNDPQLLIQLRRLQANSAAIADRDIVLIALPYESPSPTPVTFTATDAQAARRRFHVAPSEFAVILIGKDGGEKLRSSKPLTLDQLRDTIDAMPMRQQEMRFRPQQ